MICVDCGAGLSYRSQVLPRGEDSRLHAAAAQIRRKLVASALALAVVAAGATALAAESAVAAAARANPRGTAAVADEIHWTFTGDTSVTFDWRGGVDTIAYGLAPGSHTTTVTAVTPSIVPFSSAGPFWEARLTGLQANTRYYYSIAGGAESSFHTPPLRGSSGFTVAVEADIGNSIGTPDMATVQSQIRSIADLDWVMLAGDLSYGNLFGLAAVDQHFNDVMVWSLDHAYMPIWGNHEWPAQGDDLRNYKGRVDLPNQQESPGAPAAGCCGEDWYWFDYGNVRFIAYPEPYSAAAWADWNAKATALMDAAQADTAITFIVTFGHRPAYSSGPNPGSALLQGYLDALGEAHAKYVLNLNGHSHNYERTFPQHGVVHVTAGTGGAGFEPESNPANPCTPDVWRTGCPPPPFSAFRALRFGPVAIAFTATRIDGRFICGPSGGPDSDLDCVVGAVADTFTIEAPSAVTTSSSSSTTTSSTAASTTVTLSSSSTTLPDCRANGGSACDDGSVCTVDTCSAAGACDHQPVADFMRAVAASGFVVTGCDGGKGTKPIVRLVRQASALIDQAGRRSKPKARMRLAAEAQKKLARATRALVKARQRGLAPSCADGLATMITHFGDGARCVNQGP